MAITQGRTYEIDDTKKTSIDQFEYSKVSSGDSADGFDLGFVQIGGSEPFVGVSQSFEANCHSEFESYISGVKAELDKLTAKESNGSINGTGVEGAIKSYIEAVKTMVEQWLTTLGDAEKAIITSVNEAYKSQDTNLSSDLGTDKSSVASQNI